MGDDRQTKKRKAIVIVEGAFDLYQEDLEKENEALKADLKKIMEVNADVKQELTNVRAHLQRKEDELQVEQRQNAHLRNILSVLEEDVKRAVEKIPPRQVIQHCYSNMSTRCLKDTKTSSQEDTIKNFQFNLL